MEASSASPLPAGHGVQVSPGRNGGVPAARPLGAGAHAGARPQGALDPVALPPERRFSASTLAGLAAAFGVVAIVLGAWAFYSGVRADSADTAASGAPPAHQQAIALLARADVERLPLRGSVGRIILVVEPSGDGTLVLNGLSGADSRWTYQAWVTPANAENPRPAALFSGHEALVPLTAPVPPGAAVAVTLEPAAGSFAPTRTPRLVVERPIRETSSQSGSQPSQSP